MTLLEEALTCPQCIMSVMGDHAGEGVDAIFDRKATDMERIDKTFWLMKSPKARPTQVQAICKTIPAYTIFVEPATKGGARPTTAEDSAREYSDDRKLWHRLPEGISPVTGKIGHQCSRPCFRHDDRRPSMEHWIYGVTETSSDIRKPLKFILGCSTVCAVRKDMTSHPERMKSRYRGIVAVARLAKPYCVWLR